MLLLVAVGCSQPNPHAGQYVPFRRAPDGTEILVSGSRLVLEGDGSFKMHAFPVLDGSWTAKEGVIELRPRGLQARKLTMNDAGELIESKAADGTIFGWYKQTPAKRENK